MADNYTPRMRTRYDDVIVKAMTEKFGYKHAMEVPKNDKIVLNMGVGEATQDKKKGESAADEMEQSADQKPVVTEAKKSIAQFKLSEGMPRTAEDKSELQLLIRISYAVFFLNKIINT